MSQDSAIQPVAVVFHQRRGSMSISWSDGVAGEQAGNLLRAACKCAECEAARRGGQRAPPLPGIRLQAIEPMGEFGLHLIFDDGHARGIYPWTYLHALWRRGGSGEATQPADSHAFLSFSEPADTINPNPEALTP